MERLVRKLGAAASIVLCTCCGGPRSQSETGQVATFRGPPDVRFRTTGELKRADLMLGLPAWRIEGPHDLAPRVSIFDDVDRDGLPGAVEPRTALLVRSVEGGLGLDPTSFRAGAGRDFDHPVLFVEFVQGGHAQTYSHSIE